jgi:hypothetical protein
MIWAPSLTRYLNAEQSSGISTFNRRQRRWCTRRRFSPKDELSKRMREMEWGRRQARIPL